MFERSIHAVIDEGIKKATARPKLLRRLLSVPGWEEREIDDLVERWGSDEGKPNVVHGYARIGGPFPCYAIVLSAEGGDQDYIGDGYGLDLQDDGVKALIAEEEKEAGEPLECGTQRWRFTYSVYVYAEHPEVCLAYYNVLRSIFIGSKRRLLEDGMETPTFSGLDLMPEADKTPESIFVRQFNITGYAHLFFTSAIGLGPFVTRRVRNLRRAHVANNVTGVNPGVTPIEE
jgi:hypothetical protein